MYYHACAFKCKNRNFALLENKICSVLIISLIKILAKVFKLSLLGFLGISYPCACEYLFDIDYFLCADFVHLFLI